MSTSLQIVGFLAVVVVVYFGRRRRSTLPLPPGPKRLPFIGNALSFPKARNWEVFAEWKKLYGDIVYADVLGNRMLILNSFKACNDLLDKRSNKYSDRPRMVMSNELVGWDYMFVLMPYSTRWRAHRRLFHQFFNENASKDHQATQEKYTHAFMRRLLQNPDGFFDHIRLFFAQTAMDVMYGVQVKDNDDVYVEHAVNAMESFNEASIPGKFLVDLLPSLRYAPKWFPGAKFKRLADGWKPWLVGLRDLPSEHVRQGIEKGTAGPSVFASMLTYMEEKHQEFRDSKGSMGGLDNVAQNCAANTYVAGADTTLSSIQAFFLAMANHPECQKAAQDELDQLLGGTRLPTFADRDDLPYIAAAIREALRWHNVIPLGIPHCTTEDDEYEGYFIPKGTTVIPNIWHVCHDPEVFPDPDKFDPSRWLMDTPEGKKLSPLSPDADAVFGFGRRVCPGRHFATNAMFIVMTSVLASFDIAPLGSDGKPTNYLERELIDGTLIYPVPYKVAITPRSEKAAQLVRDTD